ncbi:MAG: dihydroorotate dehydrogenase electron transfer subunit [Thermoplasmata archaeon]|nr:dihydroorotate dehydrogenase electron transfer subunit [Thermoplasmata archaeon]
MRQVVRVTERVQETPSTVTLRFDHAGAAAPGQFVMLWLPGDDELPMSLSWVGDRKGVTVKAMGDTSRRILDIPVGTRLGVRGPYGTKFDLSRQRVLLVGGGSGTAVLAPAAEAALAQGAHVTAALGATTANELLFEDRLRSAGAKIAVATDDGTVGHHGFVTELADRLLHEATFDVVWTCGPEKMMRKVADSGRSVGAPVVFSVERHMKCALGMCDACSLGPFHVCVDGPVFPAEQIARLDEFGRFKRDPSGRLVAA